MFEHRNQPLASQAVFARRMARFIATAMTIMLGSLLLGILGYHFFEGLSWLDSLLNASMLLGGMGPLAPCILWQGNFLLRSMPSIPA